MDPEILGVSTVPRKVFFFLANLFPPRVLRQGVVTFLFGSSRTRQKNVGSGFKIWFYATFWFNATLRAYGVVNISLGVWINGNLWALGVVARWVGLMKVCPFA